MKIVQVYTQFLPSLGGIQINMYNLGRRLVEGGHEVTVLTSNSVGERSAGLPSEEIIGGIRVMRSKILPGKLFHRLVLAPSIIPKLLSIDADVFHVFSFLPYFLTNIACVVSKLRGIPLIVTPTFHPNRHILYNNLAGKLVKAVYDDFIGIKLLRKADYVIALTEEEVRFYRKNGVKNACVIPVGIDYEKQTCEPQEVEEFRERLNLGLKVILCVGRLEKRKGIEYAIKAMPIVLNAFPEAKLLIVGEDWGYRNQLEDLTRKLSVEKNVVFAGRLNFTELSCAYELADMVVIPSIFEVFSHIVIEAWVHKKPVIATKTVGLAELISAETGILVSYGDYKALADAVIKVLSDKELAKLIGVNGYRLVKKKFSWDKVVYGLEKVYRLLTMEGK